MFFGPLILIAFVVLIVYLLNGGFGQNTGAANRITQRAPLERLKERFARGQIDEKEFTERRKLLEN